MILFLELTSALTKPKPDLEMLESRGTFRYSAKL